MRTLASVCGALIFAATLSSAATISSVDLFATNAFSQTSNSQPTTSIGYFFAARLYLENPGDFSAANVILPGGVQPTNGTNGGANPDMALTNTTTFEYQSPFLSLSALNSEFPTGTYTYAATGSPDQTVAVSWAGPDYATSVPYITDYSSLVGMNSAAAFGVTLDAFTNALSGTCGASGTTCSYIFFDIYNSSNVDVFSHDFAPSSTTSINIPSGTLQPGMTYTYTLYYSNRQVESYTSGSAQFDPQFGSDLVTTGSFTTAEAATTPEPSTAVLTLLGIAAAIFARQKSQSR